MIQELVEYGLSHKEAEVYLALLKLGTATANRITEIVDMPRSTVYEILDKLRLIGLLSTIIIGSKTNFIASKPQRLVELLDEKKNSIKKVLPSLIQMQAQIDEKPFTEVFQGNIAVYKIFDEIIDNANKEILIIGSMQNAIEKIYYRTDKFRNLRKERGIKVKQILEKSQESTQEKIDKYTEVKYLTDLKNSKEVIFIIEGCVYHVLLKSEISAIKIKSKEHTNTMKILFESLWKK
ncbi:MAG: helix-turn-helix domain-containing protein [Nanoarchaeota archaeon]